MSKLAYELALKKNPPIQNRKVRRASWKESRRSKYSTHASAETDSGSHRQRTLEWRALWPRMSAGATILMAQRTVKLLEALKEK